MYLGGTSENEMYHMFMNKFYLLTVVLRFTLSLLLFDS